MTIDVNLLTYHCDGLAMIGRLVAGPRDYRAPAILVAHEAPGVGELVEERAFRLAKLGYVAMALDMYGGAEFSVADAMARHEELVRTPGAMRRRALAALDVLAAQPGVDPDRMACIGFCQGGMTAMELARAGAPIKAAVGFHSGLVRPAGSETGPIAAKVLMLLGAQDPVVPADDWQAFADEMTAAGADWQIHVYGGTGHSYTSPEIDALGIPGFAYNANADRRSWTTMLDLFAEVFC